MTVSVNFYGTDKVTHYMVLEVSCCSSRVFVCSLIFLKQAALVCVCQGH